MSLEEVTQDSLERCDLLAVGGPTEILSASKPVKEFLARLRSSGLRGKRAFAFDTRLEARFSGSAAKYIERHLARLGMEVAHPPLSAIVRGMTKEEGTVYGDSGAPEWVRKLEKSGGHEPAPKTARVDLLLPGWQDACERIGKELGLLLAPLPA